MEPSRLAGAAEDGDACDSSEHERCSDSKPGGIKSDHRLMCLRVEWPMRAGIKQIVGPIRARWLYRLRGASAAG